MNILCLMSEKIGGLQLCGCSTEKNWILSPKRAKKQDFCVEPVVRGGVASVRPPRPIFGPKSAEDRPISIYKLSLSTPKSNKPLEFLVATNVGTGGTKAARSLEFKLSEN